MMMLLMTPQSSIFFAKVFAAFLATALLLAQTAK
jgi:hypothetical protein